ncbi:hypothetical protein JCM3765_006820 [Sporobolomyces pararoseus]
MDEFDPLNSPSRTQAEPIVSTSPFSSLFVPPPRVEPPPLIDFTSSPSPPRSSKPSFQPRPLTLSTARQTLFPPPASNPRRSSPLKFSVLEDSFSDFPPSFADTSLAPPSHLATLAEQDCEEGGLVSFIQDSPPPSLKRQQQQAHDKENVSPSRRIAKSGESGKKWGVISKLKEDRARRRSRSLSPVKEAVNSPFHGSTREGDSIAQIGNVDMSLIQDEAGSFLLADDDSTIGQSFENERSPARSPGNLSQIGEEDEEEEEAVQAENRVIVEEEISVGLSTMFLNKPAGQYDISLIDNQSKFIGTLSGRGGGSRTFDQSTLPRQFQPPNPFSASTSTGRSTANISRSKSTSSILPPELVSPVKTRTNQSRPLPSTSKKAFQSLPTPAPSPPTQVHPRDESHFSMALPHDEHCSFLNKSSQSFIKECKSPRKKPATRGRLSDMTDASEEGVSTSESDSSGSRGLGGGVGEMTEFGFTQLLAGNKSEMSTALFNQLPPTAIFNPESTRTIELCLQPPLRPDNSRGHEEDDLASSTRTIKATQPKRGSGEEIDLMGMEEPSLMYQNQTLAFAGDLTMENQSMAGDSRSGRAARETGAERLRRRMDELKAQKSLPTIPATPAAATSTLRFVSLLDQTPAPPPNFASQPGPRSTVRRAGGGPALGRSKSESLVGGCGGAVGKLISFDTPAARTNSRTTSLVTPARASTSTSTARRPPTATTPLSRPTSQSSNESAQKTPGERKESTRARLERMRIERKQREEELLRRSNSPEKPTTTGGGLKRSKSVGNRAGGGTSSTLTERMASSSTTRRASLVPTASTTSRLVKRQSLIPAASISAPSQKPPLTTSSRTALKLTTSSSRLSISRK